MVTANDPKSGAGNQMTPLPSRAVRSSRAYGSHQFHTDH